MCRHWGQYQSVAGLGYKYKRIGQMELSLLDQIRMLKENKEKYQVQGKSNTNKAETPKQPADNKPSHSMPQNKTPAPCPQHNIKTSPKQPKNPPGKTPLQPEGRPAPALASVATCKQQVFSAVRFCIPVHNVELTAMRARAIRKIIEENAGVYCELEELKELKENSTEEEKSAIDYFLVDKSLEREKVKEEVDPFVTYKDILDFNYIFDCLKDGKQLPTEKYALSEKAEELVAYVQNKIKQKQQIERLEKQFYPKKFIYKPGCGIEIDDGTETQQSRKKSEDNSQVHPAQQPKSMPKPQNAGYNKALSRVFEQMRDLHQKEGDLSRAYLYDMISVFIIKPSTPRIYEEKDVNKLLPYRFIGYRTANKMREFIRTGSMSRLDTLASKQVHQACSELQKIYGVGKAKALSLFQAGIKSVQDLRNAVELGQTHIHLTKNQLIGLRYYEQLNQRIPYDKVTRMFQFVKGKFVQIFGTLDEHNMEVCGSYRRKKPTCGDVDIIISRKDGRFEKDLVSKLVAVLTQCSFLTDCLTGGKINQQQQDSSISFNGICMFEGAHHRLDIKYYPVEQYPYALLYFTGSENFNRNIRNHALRSGYTLSDCGMWQAQRVGKNLCTNGAPLVFLCEEEIFAFLKIKYKKPEERSV